MSRKVLLSFLGNNQYKQTRYTFKNRRSKVVRFVQEAILQLECADWKQTDQVFIFLTTAATKNNWDGDLYEGKGLAKTLQAFSHLSIQPIKQIPRGISEQETLQDWAAAAADFQLHGSVTLLSALTNNSLEPILKTAKGKEVAAQTLQQIDQSIQELVPLIQTNRGKSVGQFDFDALNLALALYQNGFARPFDTTIRFTDSKYRQAP